MIDHHPMGFREIVPAEQEDVEIEFYDPLYYGFSALLPFNISRSNFGYGRKGYIIHFLVLWSVIGLIEVFIGYVALHVLLPTLSTSIYNAVLADLATYYRLYVEFAESEWFYPASVGVMIALYTYSTNLVTRFFYSSNLPTYCLRDRVGRLFIYCGVILTTLYGYLSTTYGVLFLWLFLISTTVILGVNLRALSDADKYDPTQDNTFYPRRIPVSILYGGIVFSVGIAITGKDHIAVYSMLACIGGFILLCIFRAIYVRVFNTTPKTFYAYSISNAELDSLDKPTEHAAFVAAVGSLLQKGLPNLSSSSPTTENTSSTYDPVGEHDKALNRGVTPLGERSETTSTPDAPSEPTSGQNQWIRDPPTDITEFVAADDSSPSMAANVTLDEPPERKGDSSREPSERINTLPEHRTPSSSHDWSDPFDDVSADDFDEPVLHYGLSIDESLVYDVDQNPLIDAMEVLEEAEEVVTDDEPKIAEIISLLQNDVDELWYTIEGVVHLRDEINENWVNRDGIGDEISDLGYQYANQLTRVERYLRRVGEES